MNQVTFRALALLRRPAVLISFLVLALAGSALVALPPLRSPGYELGLLLAILTGVLGGVVGAAAGFQESRLLQGRDPRPKGALRLELPLLAVGAPLLASLLVLIVALAAPFVVSVLAAMATTACDPLALVGFYPLLTIPSAVMASTTGVFAALLGRTRLGAAAVYSLLFVASLVLTAYPVVLGPQVFASNVFLGYLPGPLYDEALKITPALLWSRLEALLAAAFLGLLASLLLDVKHGRLGRPHLLRLATIGLLLGAGFGLASLWTHGPELGLRMTDDHLAERLGGFRTTPHFEIHYPRGMEKLAVDRLARDLEFRRHQIATFLGSPPPSGKIRAWLYRNDEEKRLLVGAGRTQFAKPWRLEFHISDRPFPHNVLAHELAHVMAAPLAGGLFNVPAKFGVWPVMGITEGLAVAADDHVQGDLTLHQWAAGMRREGLAPDLRSLLGPEGFYANAPGRAYTLVGSFLRWLAETEDKERLRSVYGHGDFQAAYGRPLETLVGEWEAYLDAVPLEPSAVARAFARFKEKPLFARACGREVARMQEEARLSLASDPDRALTLYDRSASLQPDDHSFALGKAKALEKLERYAEANETLTSVAERVKDRPALVADVSLALADLATQRGLEAQAREYLDRVLALAPGPDAARTAQVKLAALEDPAVARGVAAYFEPGREDLRLLKLQRALQAAPDNRYLHYLLGRRLGHAGAPELATEHLIRTLSSTPEAAPLSAEITREAWRLRLEASYLAGDCDRVQADLREVPPFDEAFTAQALQWSARCEFEAAAFGGPLKPNAPLVKPGEPR